MNCKIWGLCPPEGSFPVVDDWLHGGQTSLTNAPDLWKMDDIFLIFNMVLNVLNTKKCLQKKLFILLKTTLIAINVMWIREIRSSLPLFLKIVMIKMITRNTPLLLNSIKHLLVSLLMCFHYHITSSELCSLLPVKW